MFKINLAGGEEEAEVDPSIASRIHPKVVEVVQELTVGGVETHGPALLQV